MSCYRCADKFKLFNREIGCGNCGFSFCSKCCSNKISVPKKANKVLNVCAKCYESIKNPQSNSNENNQRDKSPPLSLLKLREKNMAKTNPPIVIDEDRLIAERLERLKNSNNTNKNTIPTDKELESKLRNLQGINEQHQKLSNIPTKDIVKTSDDLINKVLEEVNIDKRHGDFEKEQIEQLEKRLQNLKTVENKVDEKNEINDKTTNDIDVAKPNLKEITKKVSNSMDDLVEKMLHEAEQSLKVSKKKESNNVGDDDDDDDDKWCCICNNDSDLRCIDCDNDFYCKRCFKQTHNSYEYKQHRKSDKT